MDFKELVANQDKQKLVDIVVSLSEKYSEIENEVSACLGVLDEKEEIQEVKQHIRQVIRSNKIGGFIYSSGCDNIMFEFDEIIDRCLTRSEQGFNEVAYTILLDITEQAIKLASTADSSNGTITETLEQVLKALIMVGNTVDQGSNATLKKNMFNAIIRTSKKKIFDGWPYDRYALLQTAVSLVTTKNGSKLLKTSRDFVKNNSYDYTAMVVEDLIIQIMIMQRLGNEKGAVELMDTHLRHSSILKMRILYAMSQSELDLAEKLVLSRIETNQPRDYYWTKEWYEILDTIYEETNQVFKRIENLKTMVTYGDISEYPVLKALLIEEGFWDEDYPKLLKKLEETLDVGSFVWILEQEKEWERLLSIAKEHTSLIAYYGKHLYEDYPDEVADITYEWIKTSLEEASDRKAYRKVGKLILSYSKYGDINTARFWVLTIKNAPENKRKSALQDEMNTVLEKLK